MNEKAQIMNNYIAARYSQFLNDLETIVNIDSGSQYLPGIARVVEFFEERFAALNWYTCKHRFSEKYGFCLEVSNMHPSAPQGKYDLLCVGHMDTVFPEKTTAERPFSVVDNKGMGPGIIDMKAGLVTVLHVAETLQDFGVTDKLSLCIAFNADEEVGSPSSREWIETLARQSKRVFVFEPRRASGHFVLQRKGSGGYYIHCYGKAAHSGVEPEKGINAVVELAHQILKVNTFENPEVGTTVNINVIFGGTKMNVIPDYAVASIDVRVTEIDEAHRIDTLFKQLCHHTTVEGATVEVFGGINRPPMVPSEETLLLWEQLVAIGEKTGLQMKWKATGGGSDGNFTAALGLATIDAVGPIGGNAHSRDEYLDLESITPTVQFVCNVCATWAEEELCE